MRQAILLVCIAHVNAIVNSQFFENKLEETTNTDQVLLNCLIHFTSISLKEGILIIFAQQNDSEMYIKHICNTNITSPICLLHTGMNQSQERIINSHWKYGLIIIVAKTVDGIETVFKQFYQNPIWEPRSRYLVVYLGEGIIDNIFKLAFKRYILNLNVILKNNSNIFSYYPYRNGHCGEQIQAELLGNCYATPWQELYPTKVPTVLNGCVIRVITGYYVPGVINVYANSDDPRAIGYEEKMATTIMQKMNLTSDKIMLNVTGYPYKLENGSYTYSSILYYLYEDLYDMAYGRIYLNQTFVYDFDGTRVYYLDTLKWHAPTAELGAQWVSIVLIFQATLWYIVFGTLFVNAFVWWIFNKVTGSVSTYTECLLGSFVTLLNGAVPLPRKTTMRYLVTTWTMFALLLITAYQSMLLSILLKPVYEKQIATEDDILESGLNVIMLKEHFHALYDNGVSVQSKIAAMGKQIDYMTYSRHRMNYTKDIMFIASEMTSKYLIPRMFMDSNGKKMMYIFEESHAVILNSMYFRKGFPFSEQFNKMLSYVLYSGLLNKWIHDVTNTPPDLEDDPQRIPLNVNHLACAFLFLGIGYCISMLTLLLEIYIYKILST